MTGVARSSRCRFVLARAIRPKETEPSLFQWMPNCVAERQVGGREPLSKQILEEAAQMCGRQAPSQLNSEVRRQRLWRNPFGLDQSAEASKQAAVIFESPRLVVLRGKAFLEGRKIRVKASNLVGCVHSCAPCCWNKNFSSKTGG